MGEDDYKYRFGEFEIPEYMRSGVVLYVHEGINPGGFLTAIITNNLKHAVQYADQYNMRNIPAYVNYFYNHAPLACWGSEEKMKAWVNWHNNRRSG